MPVIKIYFTGFMTNYTNYARVRPSATGLVDWTGGLTLQKKFMLFNKTYTCLWSYVETLQPSLVMEQISRPRILLKAFVASIVMALSWGLYSGDNWLTFHINHIHGIMKPTLWTFSYLTSDLCAKVSTCTVIDIPMFVCNNYSTSKCTVQSYYKQYM